MEPLVWWLAGGIITFLLASATALALLRWAYLRFDRDAVELVDPEDLGLGDEGTPAQAEPRLGDLWWITVSDPMFGASRQGRHLCRVSFFEGYLCWTLARTGDFWLDLNDSAISHKELFVRPEDIQ